MSELMPDFIEDLKVILSTHTVLINAKNSLHILFTKTPYGCEKDYTVAVVHEAVRIKEDEALSYFKKNYLLDEADATPTEYFGEQLKKIALNTPKYIQNVGYMLTTTKDVPEVTFSNKFKHDYWKKISSVKGLEAVIDISSLTVTATECEAEDTLRAIIRKRKEVHQLKKIAFVWIVEVIGENTNVSTVMKHYFEEDVMIVGNGKKRFYVAWSTPLQSINMRYFVCPPA